VRRQPACSRSAGTQRKPARAGWTERRRPRAADLGHRDAEPTPGLYVVAALCHQRLESGPGRWRVAGHQREVRLLQAGRPGNLIVDVAILFRHQDPSPGQSQPRLRPPRVRACLHSGVIAGRRCGLPRHPSLRKASHVRGIGSDVAKSPSGAVAVADGRGKTCCLVRNTIVSPGRQPLRDAVGEASAAEVRLPEPTTAASPSAVCRRAYAYSKCASVRSSPATRRRCSRQNAAIPRKAYTPWRRPPSGRGSSRHGA